MNDTRFQPGNTLTPKRFRQSIGSLSELLECNSTDLQDLSVEECLPIISEQEQELARNEHNLAKTDYAVVE
jgi:hypothetical protein